ncbi:alpha/beta hydrolase family protein [Streptomyces sp. NBC_00377]|uniref:alpha/beta hydrolase n=1 Tax=unclassified Streptomyces TaxID=2593676 RepID=UPI002E1E1C39|nr:MULTISPECIES: alpha/beta hydrolase [unclassified Streptomyces]
MTEVRTRGRRRRTEETRQGRRDAGAALQERRGEGETAREQRRERGTSRGRRGVRAVLAVLVTAAVVVPLTAAARPPIPAPAPATLAPLTAATLEEAYAANRANAALASRMAAAHGDRHRAAADRALAAPSRRLLSFDGRGAGRAVEVFGDLAHADRVAVLVPGSDTSLDTYERFRAGAAALHGRLTREATAPRTAVVAWLGYTTPGTISTTAITPDRADEAAPDLREFLRELSAVTGPGSRVTLLCHSYGSVVCGRAAPHLEVTDLVLLGSPGTGAESAADLRTRALVWAARGADDWVADVPHVSADLFGTTVGFGTDPLSPSFGAHVFAAGAGGHSDYFKPGSVSLANIARIVLGRTSEVTGA